MRRSWRPALVLAVVVLPAAVACQALVGIGDDRFTFSPPDAGSDASTVTDRCPHSLPPGVPDVKDTDTQRSFVFSARRIDTALRAPSGQALGFDLDGMCTCDTRSPEQKPTCTLPPAPLAAGGCDEDAGIDSALLHVFEDPRLAGASSIFSADLACGRRTLLMVLAGYNGLRDDPDVQVGTILGDGIREPHDGGEAPSAPGCGGDFADGGPLFPPKWDTSDRWAVRVGDVAYPPTGPLATARARGWVNDYELVVDGSASMSIVMGPELVTISSPKMSAHLVPVDDEGRDLPLDAEGKTSAPPAAFRIENAVLAGRATAASVLAAAGRSKVGGGPEDYLCAPKFPVYQQIKSVICSAVDLPALAERDFKGDPCDALSFTIGFDGAPAGIGTVPAEVVDVAGGDGGCGPTWVDACDLDAGR